MCIKEASWLGKQRKNETVKSISHSFNVKRIIGDMLVNGAADIWDLVKSLNFTLKIEHN